MKRFAEKICLPGKYPAGYIPGADGLRVLCILMVAWFHIWQQSWLWPVFSIGKWKLSLVPEVRTGYLAVDLILLLSGFLLALPYARSLLHGDRLPEIGAFYRKRARRIVPSYYFAIFIALLYFLLSGGHYGSLRGAALDIVGHITFTQDLFYESYMGTKLNSALWTLAVEVQFYLLLPLFGRGFVKKPFITWLAMTGTAFFYRFVYVMGLSDSSLYVNRLPAMLDVYANGMLAAVGYVYLKERVRPKWWTGLLSTMTAILCLWGIVRLMRGQAEIQNDYQLIREGQMLRRFPLSVLGGVFLLAVSQASGWFQWLFSNRLVRFLSGISFQYYMWHSWIALRLKDIGIPASVAELPNQAGEQPWQNRYTFLCFFISLVVAVILTYCWEKPINQLMTKLSERRQDLGTHS